MIVNLTYSDDVEICLLGISFPKRPDMCWTDEQKCDYPFKTKSGQSSLPNKPPTVPTYVRHGTLQYIILVCVIGYM